MQIQPLYWSQTVFWRRGVHPEVLPLPGSRFGFGRGHLGTPGAAEARPGPRLLSATAPPGSCCKGSRSLRHGADVFETKGNALRFIFLSLLNSIQALQKLSSA